MAVNEITATNLSGGAATGIGISVAATSSPGTTIHTSSGNDEVWLWACNRHGSFATATRTLTIEWSQAGTNYQFEYSLVSDDGLIAICPGWMLTSGDAVTAFSDSANLVNIFGFVNRIQSS